MDTTPTAPASSHPHDTATLARTVLLDAFGRVHDEIPQICEDLSVEDALWRPDPDANSIGWLLWHLARVQDDHLAGLADTLGRPRPQVWAAWRARFDLPYEAGAIGYGHSSADVAAFGLDDVADLSAYHDDVHKLTVTVLGELGADDLDRVVDEAWDPPVTALARLVSVVNDTTAHVGQAAYLKGMLARR